MGIGLAFTFRVVVVVAFRGAMVKMLWWVRVRHSFRG